MGRSHEPAKWWKFPVDAHNMPTVAPSMWANFHWSASRTAFRVEFNSRQTNLQGYINDSIPGAVCPFQPEHVFVKHIDDLGDETLVLSPSSQKQSLGE